MQARRNLRHVDGVLLLDKPLRISSNAALQHVKRLFRAEKAGHTGTLDPLATGVLPICFGEATKFGGVLLEADKGYRAILKLGERTATGDAEGEVLERSQVDVDASQLALALERFRGAIIQVPPMYSALKHQGRPLYELARKGLSVERKSRSVHIFRLDLVKFEGDECILDVMCSKGTYIRTLAEDIGTVLGCGAHLSGLQRTQVGPFGLEQARSMEQLEEMTEPGRDAILRPVDELVRSWLRVNLSMQAAGRFQQGQAVDFSDVNSDGESGKIAVYDASGVFLGIGELDASGKLKPRRLLGIRQADKAPAPI